MRKMKKTLALLAIVAMVLTMVPMQVFAADSTSTRLAGADRIATAIAIADAFGSADTVILAAADDANLVDSLAVAPLAGKVSPIYLTYKDALDAAVKAKLSGKKVIAIGAVSDAVVADAKTVATSVEKVAGADRLATNDLINAKLTSPAGTFVVGYNAIPDALSVASFAAANNYAIVLANPDGSVDSAKIKGSKTYIIGGPTLVADITGATRLFGLDRFDTNVEVIKALTFDYSKVYIANGVSLVDALAASSLAAQTGAPIILTDNATVKAASTVNAKLKSTSVVIALGGTGVVSDSVKALVAYGNSTFEVESVSVIDANHIKVVFTQAVDETTATDTDNYTFEGLGDAGDLYFTEADVEGNIVTLELDEDEGQGVLDNDPDDDVKYSVEITDVENTSEDVMVDYNEIVSLYDDTKPTVESVEMDNRDTLKITFSEDVKNTGTITIEDEDGDEIETDSIEIDEDDASIINVTGLGDEDDGDYTVTIEDVKDLAGNKIADTEEDFTLEEDNSDPDVKSVKSISATTLKVTFDEAIDAPFTVDVYNADGDTVVYTVDTDDDIVAVSGTDKTAFYVTVTNTNALDDTFSHKVVISDYEDFAGNEGDPYDRYVRFDNNIGAELDSTEATIKSYGGHKYAVLTYDQDVVGNVNVDADGEQLVDELDGYYVDEDEDEIDVEIDASDIYAAEEQIDDNDTPLDDTDDVVIVNDLDQLDDDQVAISLADLDEGDYTVTLPEGFIAANDTESDEVDVTFTVTEEEEDDVVVEAVYDSDNAADALADYGIDMDDADVLVVFSGEVDGDSALDTDNYALDGDAIFDDADFVDSDKEAVLLTVGDGELDETLNTIDDDVAFTVEDIEDVDGNAVEDYDSSDEDENLTFYNTEGPQIDTVELTGDDTIEITFTEAIDNADDDIDKADFKVTVDGDAVEIDDVDTTDDTTFTITLEEGLEDYETLRAGTSADFDGEDADGNLGEVGKLKTID